MKPDEQEYRKEKDLEPPLSYYLDLAFTQDPSSPYCGDAKIIANTARSTRQWGQWQRPDMMLIAIKKLPLHHWIKFRVYSFELKRPDYGKVQSVHQALAHNRFANYAFVVWYIPQNNQATRRLN